MNIKFADHQAQALTFSPGNGKPVMTITADGRLVPGEGLSNEEATRAVFEVMARAWPEFLDAWATRRAAA